MAYDKKKKIKHSPFSEWPQSQGDPWTVVTAWFEVFKNISFLGEHTCCSIQPEVSTSYYKLLQHKTPDTHNHSLIQVD